MNHLKCLFFCLLLVHSAENGLFLLRICKILCWIFLCALNVLHKARHTGLSLVGVFFSGTGCMPA